MDANENTCVGLCDTAICDNRECERWQKAYAREIQEAFREEHEYFYLND